MALALALILLSKTAASPPGLSTNPDIPYDHQTATYVADLEPYVHQTPVAEEVHVTPYFSPDWSSNVTVELINSAQHTIDIETPSFASWSGCTPFTSAPNCTAACSAADVMKEAFPVLPALLNAMHLRGVKVRLVTNNFGSADCAGTFTPLTLLLLNGARVRWYTTTTFMHAKYINVDGERASVSSINFSKTSFTKNREAGAIISGGCGHGGGDDDDEAAAATAAVPPPTKPPLRACEHGIVAHMARTFERDFERATPAVPNHYDDADLAIVTDPAALPVNAPGPPTPKAHTPPYFVTPQPATIKSRAAAMGFHASPDFAFDTLMADLASVKASFDLMIYQITEPALCDRMLELAADPAVALRLFVSSRIFGAGDCAAAQACYQRFWDAGVPVHMTTLHYTFSHQKFWIRDGDAVTWSTGNWSPSDYPKPPADTPASGVISLPPFKGSSGEGWRSSNRDYTVTVTDAAVAKPFQDVFDNDWAVGYDINLDTNFTIACGF